MQRDVLIEYRNVWKAFDLPVLQGVDLSVARGETLAVVGPSGTGKSVLLKTTVELIIPDRGVVTVGGTVVTGASAGLLEQVRQRVGYVFQNAALFDSMSVFDNVAQGLPETVIRSSPRRELVVRVADALERVNLEPAAVLPKLPAELSGGMRKRVGLARAIVARPEILLFDEPVTGLDPVNAAAVHRLITRLTRQLSATAIVVTHDIQGGLSIADRVALLEGGRIRFAGTPAEFRSSDDPLVLSYLRGSVADPDDAAAPEPVELA